MAKPRFCDACGETLGEASRVCPGCGKLIEAIVVATTIPKPDTPIITCPHCGEVKSQPRAGCTHCGHIDMRYVGQGHSQQSVALVQDARTKPTQRTRKRKWSLVVGWVVLAAILLCIGTSMVRGFASSVVTTSPPPDVTSAQYVDPRMLVADPKAYVGRNIYLQGQTNTVDQKSDHTWVQLMSQIQGRDYTTESIVVEVRPKNTTVLKSECYRIYGVVKGTTKVKLVLTGAEREVPLVHGYSVASVPSGSLGIGCTNP